EKIKKLARQRRTGLIVEGKTGDASLRRPVRLRLGKDRGKEGQDFRRRVLTFKNRISIIRNTQLVAELVNRLRVIAVFRELRCDLHEARTQSLKLNEPGPERRNGRIVSREK